MILYYCTRLYDISHVMSPYNIDNVLSWLQSGIFWVIYYYYEVFQDYYMSLVIVDVIV